MNKKILIGIFAVILLLGIVTALTTISIKEDWVKLDTISSKEVCDSAKDSLTIIECDLKKSDTKDVSDSDLKFEKNSEGIIRVSFGRQ
jgi:hypothetical protein